MKLFSNLLLLMMGAFFLAGITYSCKKEVSPRLIITVKDTSGKALKGAKVHAYKGATANNGTPNKEMDQKGTTDGNGEVTFDFKYSAVLDVDVIYNFSRFDSTSMLTVQDSLIGKRVVKIESKRQRGDNVYREEVVAEK
ncbi:MAG: hypothetical protein HUU48_12855 [Flavobacteriales bacterium]|nr:hypothetical protein [Flavobacteriales bacterium]